ncbi:MAG: GNAT family acetyltransferase [Dongiaceae bacterium]
MKITPYSDSAFADVVALWDACAINVRGNDPAQEIALIQGSPNAALFLGYLGDKLVGTIMAGHDGHRGWIYLLAVAAEQRRLGFGRQLVRHAEAWIHARGLWKVNLLIRPQHSAARDFYVRLGYATQPRSVMQRRLDTDEADPGAPQIEVVITHLEMTDRPIRPTIPAPSGKLALMRVDAPSVAFFRYLYDTVGEPWFWWERRRMDDDALRAEISDPKMELYVLYIHGEPGGFVQLDRRPEPDIDIAYFGIFLQFVGRGFGPYLLNWAIDQAWSYGPKRLTVNTCTLDHPKAIRTYQRIGFVPYRQERKFIDDPRAAGLIPSHLEPRLP